MKKIVIEAMINGEPRTALADPRDTLLELLRDRLGLTGAKEGCGNGNCGSCTVLVDGQPVNACLMLAHEAPHHTITTIEGLAPTRVLTVLQENLASGGGTQCGFCTPGVIIAAHALLSTNPEPDDQDIRHAIAGNLCRCTGYDKIVRAVAKTANDLAQAAARRNQTGQSS
ncbi:MAG TPA: (2Fe-2S)-binding protein [Hyphomicrobiaceae bacterium]|nr:(2Fe-2S)-binding protein [Hyphomicrobiaceae bacterium]